MKKSRRNYTNCVSCHNHCIAHISRCDDKFSNRTKWNHRKGTPNTTLTLEKSLGLLVIYTGIIGTPASAAINTAPFFTLLPISPFFCKIPPSGNISNLLDTTFSNKEREYSTLFVSRCFLLTGNTP